jgi:hypothetical protein
MGVMGESMSVEQPTRVETLIGFNIQFPFGY